MLPAFFGFHHRFTAYFLYKSKTHICNGRRPIQPSLIFHLLNNMLQCLLFIFIQPQCLQNLLIPLCQLCRCETDRNPCIPGMILHKMHDTVKTPVHRPAIIIRVTKVQSSGVFLVFCHMDSVMDKLVNSLIFCRRNRNHRNPQPFLHFIHQNCAAVLPDLVHHI